MCETNNILEIQSPRGGEYSWEFLARVRPPGSPNPDPISNQKR